MMTETQIEKELLKEIRSRRKKPTRYMIEECKYRAASIFEMNEYSSNEELLEIIKAEAIDIIWES